MMFTDWSGGRPMAKDPGVVRLSGRYYLYYSVPPAKSNPEGKWHIGIAISDDLEQWEKIGDLLPDGKTEDRGICAPGAVVLDGTVHLFYQTYGGGKQDAICHAWSRDGIHFVRNETNPILRCRGSWSCGRAIDADVAVFRNSLFLYFATRDPEMKIQMLSAAWCPLDGKFRKESWQLHTEGPILKPELPWEQSCIEAPAAIVRDGKMYLFYAGAYNNSPQQIGAAVSEDGIRFTRLSEESLLPNGEAGSWNASESGHPYVFEDADGTVYLFYQGNNTDGESWYLSKIRIVFRDGRPQLAEKPSAVGADRLDD